MTTHTGFPVTLDGETFTEAEFTANGGMGYKTRLPQMMNAGAADLLAKKTAAEAAQTAAAASAVTALNAPGTQATSTTSLAIGTGAKTLTVQTGKAIVSGMSIKIAYTTTPTSWMHGDVTGYNSGTGSLTVNVSTISGSGTYADWTVSLSAPAATNGTDGVAGRSARTGNTILGAADKGKLIEITSGTFTQTFDAAATLGDGWWCWFYNSGTGSITLDPNSTEQIDGATTKAVWPKGLMLIVCTGSALETADFTPSMVLLASGTASSSASVSLEPSAFDDAYFSHYVIIADNVVPATDEAHIYAQLNVGGSYQTTSYEYHTTRLSAAGTAYGAVNQASAGMAASGIAIIPFPGGAASQAAEFSLRLHKPTSTTVYKGLYGEGRRYDLDMGGATHELIGGAYTGATSACTGVKFLASSGNLTSGNFYLYGVRK